MIDVVNDIFSKEERKKCLKDLQPLLVKFPNCPGKQTHPTLHLHPQFTSLIERMLELTIKSTGEDLEILNAWGKQSDGKKNKMNWHIHAWDGCLYSCVYYLKVPFFMANGTLFKEKFIRAPQNSLLIFSSNLEHTTPSHPFGIQRYIISANFK